MFQWLGKAFERKASSALADPAPWLFELFGAVQTAAGKNVSPQTALRCPAVACAVRAIAEPLGQLPVIVYRRAANESKERAHDHPAWPLLHDQANDWTSAAELRTQVTVDALLHGSGFAFVNRVDGKPRELLRLNPTAVSVQLDQATGEPVYRLTAASGQRTLSRADVLHIRCSLSHDGINGEAPIKLAREAIALAMILEEHGSRLFSAGARPSGVLSTKKSLGEQALANIRKVIEAQHTGEGKSGKTLILPDDFTFAAMALNSVDAQFLELRKYAIEEIARAFRVPPHMLYELGRATWGNAEELGAAFLTYSLMHWVKAWEGAIRRTLFSEEERKTYFAEYLVDDLLRADIAARADAYQKLISARVLNPNECRAMENRPPYDGGNEFLNPNTTSTAPAEGASA
jgi:HK97 family phage portal protein